MDDDTASDPASGIKSDVRVNNRALANVHSVPNMDEWQDNRVTPDAGLLPHIGTEPDACSIADLSRGSNVGRGMNPRLDDRLRSEQLQNRSKGGAGIVDKDKGFRAGERLVLCEHGDSGRVLGVLQVPRGLREDEIARPGVGNGRYTGHERSWITNQFA